MAKANTQVAAKATTALSSAMPDFMQQYAGQGTEAISTSDVEIPRLKLMQAISPEVTERDDLRPGEWFHTLLEESFGKSVPITIIYVDKRFILWRPRNDNGGGIIARADDGVHWVPKHGETIVTLPKSNKKVTWKWDETVEKSGLAAWGTMDPADPNSYPAATQMFNFVCVANNRPDVGPFVVTAQRSGIKPARKLLGKLKITRAPVFGLQFLLESAVEQGDEGPYQNLRFVSDGFVNAEQFAEYQKLHEHFKKEGVNIRDLEGAQDEGNVGGGETPDDGKGPKY